ncbi:MAG: hypothetical protein ABIH00_06865, partial [Armatimonadota bacterium]
KTGNVRLNSHKTEAIFTELGELGIVPKGGSFALEVRDTKEGLKFYINNTPLTGEQTDAVLKLITMHGLKPKNIDITLRSGLALLTSDGKVVKVMHLKAPTDTAIPESVRTHSKTKAKAKPDNVVDFNKFKEAKKKKDKDKGGRPPSAPTVTGTDKPAPHRVPERKMPVAAKEALDTRLVDTAVNGMDPRLKPSKTLIDAARKALVNPQPPKIVRPAVSRPSQGAGIIEIMQDAVKVLFPPPLAFAAAGAGVAPVSVKSTPDVKKTAARSNLAMESTGSVSVSYSGLTCLGDSTSPVVQTCLKMVEPFLSENTKDIIRNTRGELIHRMIVDNDLFMKIFDDKETELDAVRARYFEGEFIRAKLKARIYTLARRLSWEITDQVGDAGNGKRRELSGRLADALESLKNAGSAFNDSEVLEIIAALETKLLRVRDIPDVHTKLDILEEIAAEYGIYQGNISKVLGDLADYLESGLKLARKDNGFKDNILKLSEPIKRGLERKLFTIDDLAQFISKFRSPGFVEEFTGGSVRGISPEALYGKLARFAMFDESEYRNYKVLDEGLKEINSRLEEEKIPLSIVIEDGRTFVSDIRNFSPESMDHLISELAGIFDPGKNTLEVLRKDYFERKAGGYIDQRFNPHMIKSLKRRSYGGECEKRYGSFRINGKNGDGSQRVLFSVSEEGGKTSIILYRYFTSHEVYDKVLDGKISMWPERNKLHGVMSRTAGQMLRADSWYNKVKRYGAEFGITPDRINNACDEIFGFIGTSLPRLRSILRDCFPPEEYAANLYFKGQFPDFEIRKLTAEEIAAREKVAPEEKIIVTEVSLDVKEAEELVLAPEKLPAREEVPVEVPVKQEKKEKPVEVEDTVPLFIGESSILSKKKKKEFTKLLKSESKGADKKFKELLIELNKIYKDKIEPKLESFINLAEKPAELCGEIKSLINELQSLYINMRDLIKDLSPEDKVFDDVVFAGLPERNRQTVKESLLEVSGDMASRLGNKNVLIIANGRTQSPVEYIKDLNVVLVDSTKAASDEVAVGIRRNIFRERVLTEEEQYAVAFEGIKKYYKNNILSIVNETFEISTIRFESLVDSWDDKEFIKYLDEESKLIEKKLGAPVSELREMALQARAKAPGKYSGLTSKEKLIDELYLIISFSKYKEKT